MTPDEEKPKQGHDDEQTSEPDECEDVLEERLRPSEESPHAFIQRRMTELNIRPKPKKKD